LRTFRALQREIIEHTLQNRDAFVILPTGGGKSLCYQLPAVLSRGVTLVVSPLISLMMDQCENLKQRGIAAATINSKTPVARATRMLTDLIDQRSQLKLIYVSPEKVRLSRR
jgi:superfamily II DNA helicase RecQ